MFLTLAIINMVACDYIFYYILFILISKCIYLFVDLFINV